MEQKRKEIILPSGAKLGIALSTFSTSKELSKALLSELKVLKIDGSLELDYNFVKDILCTAIESDKIEQAILKCAERATYNGSRIDEDTFEPEEARQDYIPFLKEVAMLNIAPFMKNLSAELKQFIAIVPGLSQE